MAEEGYAHKHSSRRRAVSTQDEKDVLVKSGRRCCICFALHEDSTVKKGQIAHLDHDPANNSQDNLAFLCLEHHDEYDSKSRQSKGLSVQEVKTYRASLYESLTRRSRGPLGTRQPRNSPLKATAARNPRFRIPWIESIHFLESDNAGLGLEAIINNTRSLRSYWSNGVALGGRFAQIQKGRTPFLDRVEFQVVMDCDLRQGSAEIRGRVSSPPEDEWSYRLEGSYKIADGTPEKSFEFNLSFPAQFKIPASEKIIARFVFKPARKTIVKQEHSGRFLGSYIADYTQKMFSIEFYTIAGTVRYQDEDDTFLRFLANQGEVIRPKGTR